MSPKFMRHYNLYKFDGVEKYAIEVTYSENQSYRNIFLFFKICGFVNLN